MSVLVYKDLSYKIVGILFSVHNQLGNRFHERYYQRAVAEELTIQGLHFIQEVQSDLLYNNKKIGKYFLDFLIEDKIVLELKAVAKLLPKDFVQIRAYLSANNKELGILANFRTEKLTYKRILNGNIRTIHSD